MNTIFKTDFKFPRQISKYEGKVRDVYSLEDDILVIVASDRISAFDIIMPKPIPFKGQILNQISVDMLKSTEDIIQNWLISSPDPNVSIGKRLKPIKVEMVIRGYLSGHSARLYSSGARSICGVKLPDGLSLNEKFDNPIITPSTKAEYGHDEDIFDIIKNGILTSDQYEEIEEITFKLFTRGSEIAKKRTSGGSVPISPFVNTLGIPAVTVPTVNQDNNQHSPNENIRIDNYITGIETYLGILTDEF